MLAAEINEPVAPARTVHTQDSRLLWKGIVECVQPFLDSVAVSLMEQVRAFDSETAVYAEYALANQGKQLRPALVALAGSAVGRLNEEGVKAAVIVEMIHLATLVHDDIIDVAVIRRGRPTLAANWGNEISVLLGDCLFAQALKLATEFADRSIPRKIALATKTVCSGEILQTLRRRNCQFNRAEYYKVLAMKTGELFGLSCELGALLSGGDDRACSALRQYGLAFGTAYQIYDDCLDLFGVEAAVGKSLGTDLLHGKLTLPVLTLFEGADEKDKARLSKLVREWQPASLPELRKMLMRYDSLNQSQLAISEFIGSAREILATLENSNSRQALIKLTEFLAKQTADLGVFS